MDPTLVPVTQMAHRDRDRGERRGDDRDNYPKRTRGDGYPPKEPAREPARAAPSRLNEYFIEGDGISREVLQIDICKHLGPEATSRPATYNVRDSTLTIIRNH